MTSSTPELNLDMRIPQAGLCVFPLWAGTKEPCISAFAARATSDLHQIMQWAERFPGCNWGISTSADEHGRPLVVVDIDRKNGVDGSDAILQHAAEGRHLPETMKQVTPSGGMHVIYRAPEPLKQGAAVLGPGVDIRASGGYVVAAGSRLDAWPALRYELVGGSSEVVVAPEWLCKMCGKPRGRKPKMSAVELDERARQHAREKAEEYLKIKCPPAYQGERNEKGYRAACHLKDMGVEPDDAIDLMAEFWPAFPKPPVKDIAELVHNAWRYGKDAPGVSSAAGLFPDVIEEGEDVGALPADPVSDGNDGVEQPGPATESRHPFDEINAEFAFLAGTGGSGSILWETTDPQGAPDLQILTLSAFHNYLAAQTIQVGGKTKQVSREWMQSPRRRTYQRLVFEPGKGHTPGRFYNLWVGLAVKPATEVARRGVLAFRAWLRHSFVNVCRKDRASWRYLMSWCAHLVQRPAAKPLVALAFRGKKGTGKNAFIEPIAALAPHHSMITEDPRYLMSNFNSALETCLLFVLDEAAWAGDKQADSKLKGVVTGKHRWVERKGCEPYKVHNYTRVVIMTNEDWAVPASGDERRYAVYDVGDGHRGDTAFFREMEEGLLNHGGLQVLLQFLLDWDIDANWPDGISVAPKNQALAEQKHRSLPPVQAWWQEALVAHEIPGLMHDGDWPEGEKIPKSKLRMAFNSWADDRRIRGWRPSAREFGWALRQMAPSVRNDAQVPDPNGANPSSYVKAYRLPPLEDVRSDWEKHINQTVDWEAEEARL